MPFQDVLAASVIKISHHWGNSWSLLECGVILWHSIDTGLITFPFQPQDALVFFWTKVLFVCPLQVSINIPPCMTMMCNPIIDSVLSLLMSICPHLLHFVGPEFQLGVSVTPQCGHREVPAWLERLIQCSGPVPLTLPMQVMGGASGRGRWRRGD